MPYRGHLKDTNNIEGSLNLLFPIDSSMTIQRVVRFHKSNDDLVRLGYSVARRSL
jgi:hypothetical protein